MFKGAAAFDKYVGLLANPMVTKSFTLEPDKRLAMTRRNMLGTSFTPQAIRRAEPRIKACVARLLEKLTHYAKERKTADLSRGFMCLAADVALSFAYQDSFEALEAEDFQSELLVPVHDFTRLLQWPIYFPGLFGGVFKITEVLPRWALEKFFGAIASQKECLKVSPIYPHTTSPLHGDTSSCTRDHKEEAVQISSMRDLEGILYLQVELIIPIADVLRSGGSSPSQQESAGISLRQRFRPQYRKRAFRPQQ